MPPSIPSALAPYLQECFLERSQILLTSVLDASVNWLVPRFVASVLSGAADEDGRSQYGLADSKNVSNRSLVFMSVVHPSELWMELGKKMGVDFTSLVAAKRLAYVDGLSNGLASTTTDSLNSIKTKSLSLQDINNSITTARSRLSSTPGSQANEVIIIDGIDFVLASQPETSLLQITQFLTSLHDHFSHVIVTCSADSALLHNIEASATPLELDHSMLIRAVAHQSRWIMQLRALETGHAKDVSGVVRVSKGGAYDEEDEGLPDSEWLYQVKGDGSVRVWGRGQ